LGLLNFFLKPLLKLISFPMIILSMGLFSFFINIFILILLEWGVNMIGGESVHFDIQGGILAYLVLAVVISFMNSVVHWLIKK
nr:phage holin family protein [Candidatus Gracilibacteria bacterium]